MKQLSLSFVFILIFFCSFSQITGVGIGTSTPHSSAILELKDSARGFLPPRMSYSQRNAIVNPTAGLVIWCTNCLPKGELQVYNGIEWTNLIGGVAAVNYVQLPSITIGVQIWQSKNLDVVNYRNGDIIPKVTDATQSSTIGMACAI